MASETNTAASEAEPSFLEQLINSRNRDLSFFLPFVLGISNSSRRHQDDPDRDRIILINPLTQGMIVIEGTANLESLLRDASEKQGTPPASKASIEAMPRVAITEEGEDGECSICLDGWEIGGEAREMPCKHRFHSNCIEKWLGIHGSCPVCRFKMPIDEGECKKRSDGEEEGRRRRGEREFWVSFTFSSSGRRDSTNDGSDDSNSNRAQSGGGAAEGSASSSEESS